MVTRLLWVLTVLLTLVPTVGATAPTGFSAAVESTRVELGKPVHLRLRARHADLRDADLSALERDFIIDRVDPVDQEDAGWQSRRIRLYPRLRGELTVPALRLNGAETAPLKVEVTPARDPSDRAAIRVSSTSEAGAVWVNQAIRVVMEVENRSRDIWLTTEPVSAEGFEVIELPPEQREMIRDGKQRVLHRVGWLLYPQTTGERKLQLPPVGYRRDGIVTHRFYPPELDLTVRPLLPFVPPTLPVGSLAVEVSLPDTLFLVRNELAFLTLEVKGDGPPGRLPRELFRQFKSNEQLRFYPPRPAGVDTAAGLKRYQIPFAPKVAGVLALPPLRVQYFDPSTGKIVTERYRPDTFVSLPSWVLYTSAFLLSLAILALVRLFYRRLRYFLRRYRSYRSALYRLQQAQTPADLKTALMQIADAEAWPTNLTLLGWQRYWAEHCTHLPPLTDEIRALQAWLYGKGESAVVKMRPKLAALCYRRMPLLKLFEPERKWNRNSVSTPFEPSE